MYTADARKADEGERCLATLAVWRETSFFNDRERAALEWAESVTRVADARVPDDVWKRVQLQCTPAEFVKLDFSSAHATVCAWIIARRQPAVARVPTAWRDPVSASKLTMGSTAVAGPRGSCARYG